MAAVLRVVCDADVKMVDVRQLVGVGTFVGHRQSHVLEVGSSAVEIGHWISCCYRRDGKVASAAALIGP